MSDLIDVLCAQHRRMFTLLDLLEREVEAFGRGEAFDPYVVEGALDYVAVYPDLLHRPVELRVYEEMRRRRGPEDRVATDALEAEHATLSAEARELSRAITAVGRVAGPPRQWVVGKARRLVGGLRHHMRMEEEKIFPTARKTLSADVLDAIRRAIEADPQAPTLREEEMAFEALHRTIVRQRDRGLAT